MISALFLMEILFDYLYFFRHTMLWSVYTHALVLPVAGFILALFLGLHTVRTIRAEDSAYKKIASLNSILFSVRNINQ